MKTTTEVCNEWLLSKKPHIKQSSYTAYVFVIKRISKDYMYIKEITNKELQNYITTSYEKEISLKTIKDTVNLYKEVLIYSAKKKYIKEISFDLHYPKNYKNKKLQVLTKKEFLVLNNYLVNKESFKNFTLLICLTTGIRIGEACALKVDDILIKDNVIIINKTLKRTYDYNMRNTFIDVTEPKTVCSSREVPLVSYVKAIYKRLYSNMPNGTYILSGKNKPIEPRNFRRYFNSIKIKLNITNIKFHGLRHTFATRMIESNVDYKLLSVILGHSSITTTMDIYVHTDTADMKRNIEKMLKHINK